MLHLHPSFIYVNPTGLAMPPHDKLNKKHKDYYIGEKGFEAKLDLRDFNPDEITVKTDGYIITVEATHEDRDDGFSLVSRKLTRKFYLPETKHYDVNHLTAKLLPDGLLKLDIPVIKATTSDMKHVTINSTTKAH